MKTLIIAIIMILLPITFLHAEKWALFIAIDDYPDIDSLPRLDYATHDIQYIKDIIESPELGFSKDKVLVLENFHANIKNIHNAFKEYLSQAKKDDFIFIYFIGHSWLWEGNFSWLLYNSFLEDVERSALSSKQLAYLIEQYLHTNNILICSDARNSQQSLGKPQYNLFDFLQPHFSKNVCVIESSGYREQSYIKNNRSIFGYFLGVALQRKEYLNRNADYNSDGIITVLELANFLAWAVGFSGFHQHPFVLGKNHEALSRTPFYVNVVEPDFVEENQTHATISGFVRGKNISHIDVQGKSIPIVSSVIEIKENILYPEEVTWFSTDIEIPKENNSLTIKIFNKNNQIVSIYNWTIKKRQKGWFGEWMPDGMKKSDEYGVYLWEKDNSKMAYVPKGDSSFGTDKLTLETMRQRFTEMRNELIRYVELFEDEKKLKSILAHTLQETNTSIAKTNDKMQSVSLKMQGIDKEYNIADSMDIPLNPNIQNHIYYKKAQIILQKCYNDLQTVKEKLSETKNDISYIENLQRLKNRVYSVWGQMEQHLSGYYIDLHEVSNKQYLEFCDATSRPYPPNPWWQDNYIYDLPDYPVVNVSWEDAYAYALWSHKSLPTAKQWEKAAQGNNGQNFPWGNDFANLDVVNASVPSSPEKLPIRLPLFLPTSVHSMPEGRSRYGCYHMSGNVWEWCLDTPHNYFNKNYSRLHIFRIAKGGSFNNSDLMLYTWFYHIFYMRSRRSDLGFRNIVEAIKH